MHRFPAGSGLLPPEVTHGFIPEVTQSLLSQQAQDHSHYCVLPVPIWFLTPTVLTSSLAPLQSHPHPGPCGPGGLI